MAVRTAPVPMSMVAGGESGWGGRRQCSRCGGREKNRKTNQYCGGEKACVSCAL
ncbi:hypothetical protein A2U01_0060924 [Trifolium medium]|uniref:Uncharacterized protein n=1 Tax=Trifolium medium TaxID=97028 RepID=A0A392RU14_9FABA|nr:hypothetical protein [Trifolium medium]